MAEAGVGGHQGGRGDGLEPRIDTDETRMPPPMNWKSAHVLALLLTTVGCHSAERIGGYRAQDGSRVFQEALSFALKGNAQAVHDCFLASYLRASSPFRGGEDCEAISSGLSELVYHSGDRVFSKAIAVERPEVVAAVRFWIGPSPGFYRQRDFKSFSIVSYPRTKKILDSAPTIDFPLTKNSSRRSALLKQLSQ